MVRQTENHTTCWISSPVLFGGMIRTEREAAIRPCLFAEDGQIPSSELEITELIDNKQKPQLASSIDASTELPYSDYTHTLDRYCDSYGVLYKENGITFSADTL